MSSSAIREPWSADATPPARIELQPIADPAVLGSFALASGLIVFGLWFAGTFGAAGAPKTFFPFVLLFSGVGQLSAALWAYRARDAVAASIHGSWAAFWLGVGLIYLLATTHTIVVPARGEHWAALGQWFMYMSVVTWTTAFAALARSPVGFFAQAVLGAASAIASAALLTASPGWAEVAGWLFVAAAAFAFYVGAALMLDSVYGKVALPLLRRGKAEPIAYEHGDPGVKVGQ